VGLHFLYKKAIIVFLNTKITEKKSYGDGVLFAEHQSAAHITIQMSKHSDLRIILIIRTLPSV